MVFYPPYFYSSAQLRSVSEQSNPLGGRNDSVASTTVLPSVLLRPKNTANSGLLPLLRASSNQFRSLKLLFVI